MKTEYRSFIDAFLPEFVRGYVSAVIFTEAEESGISENERDLFPKFYGWGDQVKECKDFLSRAIEKFPILKDYPECIDSMGIDFWLTRNGHGSGFWDGDWEDFGGIEGKDLGKGLTDLSKIFGERWFMMCDDGLGQFTK